MDVAIRVNVRYAIPPRARIADSIQLFRSPSWSQFVLRHVLPQLNSTSPALHSVVESLPDIQPKEIIDGNCIVCMEKLEMKATQLPCKHQFHMECLRPWLQSKSTCPICRYQLPVNSNKLYRVQSINTTVLLRQEALNSNNSSEQDSNGDQSLRVIASATISPSGDNTVNNTTSREITHISPFEVCAQIRNSRSILPNTNSRRRSHDNAELTSEPLECVATRQSKRLRLARS